MSTINILDSSVFNRIAAGEVVDRPASVVKELVENSIDSGATAIGVEIFDGGKHIKVTDNGCGMDRADLKTAFLPHATSKIKTLSDLDSITTLGFRGEALPSIASVARVTMTSRRKEDDLAGSITLENGKVIDESISGASVGTCVEVFDLFKNIPARLKFLRSDRSEENDSSTLIQRFILANFNISITLSISGKEIYRSEGKGLDEAIYSVYGANFIKEMNFLHCTMPDIELFGYVNKPAYSKHNRSYQTLIVNGRYVINSDISFWIYNCFSNLLMKRQYPAYVLFINLPADMIDINVHPNKMEVRFVDIARIKKLLTKAISDSVSESATEPKLIRLSQDENIDVNELSAHISDNVADADDSIDAKSFVRKVTNLAERNDYARDNYIAERPDSFPHFTFASQEGPVFNETPIRITNGISGEQTVFLDDLRKTESTRDYFDFSLYRYCGKLFNTYLIFEKGKEAILIDQHAAHEKLLYTKLSAAVESGTNSVQDLMFPYIFDVEYSESELIDAHEKEITDLGFGLNKLSGNSYSFSYIPLILSGMDFREFTAALLDLLKRNKLSKINIIKDNVMQSACKAAIKGETDITEADINLLIKDICDGRIELFCPHGRPIAVRIEKTEIEKWFKRIV